MNLGFKSVAGSTEILPIVEADLKRTSEKVLDRAREVCRSKSVSIYIYIRTKPEQTSDEIICVYPNNN